MICIVNAPIDLANFVELNNLMVNLKGESQGNASVCILSNANFSIMRPGEKLYILAHGNSVSIGDYAGPQFAKELLNRGLPKHVKKIILVSCESGKGANPLCQIIAQALKVESAGEVDIPVTGFTGNAVTDYFGKTRSIDPTIFDKHSAEYKSIGQKWEGKLGEWEALALNTPCSSQDEIIRGSMLLAKASKRFFAELYMFNEKVAKSKAHSKFFGVAG